MIGLSWSVGRRHHWHWGLRDGASPRSRFFIENVHRRLKVLFRCLKHEPIVVGKVGSLDDNQMYPSTGANPLVMLCKLIRIRIGTLCMGRQMCDLPRPGKTC